MSVLEGAKAYLSGPIEYDNEGLNWRTEPMKTLKERFKLDVFDPFSDPKQQWVPALAEARKNKDVAEMSRIAKKFVKKDLSMVDRSDILVAYLPKGVPTTGTHHEIIWCNDTKKPTMLVCPQGREHLPIWYWGFMKPEFMFSSWELLYAYLDEVNERKHEDNTRWWYLYDLV